MIKFKKDINAKIMAVSLALVFFMQAAGYGENLPDRCQLRKPLMSRYDPARLREGANATTGNDAASPTTDRTRAVYTSMVNTIKSLKDEREKGRLMLRFNSQPFPLSSEELRNMFSKYLFKNRKEAIDVKLQLINNSLQFFSEYFPFEGDRQKDEMYFYRGMRLTPLSLLFIMKFGIISTYYEMCWTSLPNEGALHGFEPDALPNQLPETDFLTVVFRLRKDQQRIKMVREPYTWSRGNHNTEETVPPDILEIWLFDKSMSRYVNATNLIKALHNELTIFDSASEERLSSSAASPVSSTEQSPDTGDTIRGISETSRNL